MGYEVDSIMIEAYDQHLLSQLVDPKEERFGTFKEKDLELHKQFTAPARERKVVKIVEEVEIQMGFTQEEVKQAREKHDQMEAKVETKRPKVDSVPSKVKPKETKSAPAPVAPSSRLSPSGKGVLKQKEKSKWTYAIVSLVAYKIEFEEEASKAKKKGEFVRLVRKSPSGGAQQRKKEKSDPVPTGRPQKGRKAKTQLESGDKQGKYVPPLSIDQLIDEVIMDGNLKNIGMYYENLNEVDWRKVEEVVVLYLHNFSKTLIELEKRIPKDLYNLIYARRLKFQQNRYGNERKRADKCLHLYHLR